MDVTRSVHGVLPSSELTVAEKHQKKELMDGNPAAVEAISNRCIGCILDFRESCLYERVVVLEMHLDGV